MNFNVTPWGSFSERPSRPRPPFSQGDQIGLRKQLIDEAFGKRSRLVDEDELFAMHVEAVGNESHSRRGHPTAYG
jgi:hypothetical protein